MGLLDSLAGQVLGSLSGAGGEQRSPMLEVIGGLLNNQQGGLGGLVQAFQQKGLGEVIASWIGTGQNLPISAEQLQSVLGSEQVQAIARQLGFSPEAASEQLAQTMPTVIDQLTPGGQLPPSDAAGGLAGLLAALQNKG